jgi:hypothetical protein
LLNNCKGSGRVYDASIYGAIMVPKQQSFERQSLYEAVWKEPITKLAKQYSISDVGLRKICAALEVPIPPRGYWAKLAHGKAPQRPLLPPSKVKPTYTRTYLVIEPDPTVEQRVAQERAQTGQGPAKGTSAHATPDDSGHPHPQAKVSVKQLRNGKTVDGAVTLYGATWADVFVSPGEVDRACQLINQFANAVTAVGATFVDTCAVVPARSRLPSRDRVDKRNCFVLHGQQYVLRIKERLTEEPIPKQPRSPGQARRSTWQPDLDALRPQYRYLPTGKITLSVVSVVSYYEYQKTEDTPSSRIEAKLPALVTRLEEAAVRRKVASDIQAERGRERERRSHEWKAQKEAKDKLLETLARLEDMARNLDRAESLRRLKAKLEVCGGLRADLYGELELLTKLADWLDPMTHESWPGIDDVPDKNPHGLFSY